MSDSSVASLVGQRAHAGINTAESVYVDLIGGEDLDQLKSAPPVYDSKGQSLPVVEEAAPTSQVEIQIPSLDEVANSISLTQPEPDVMETDGYLSPSVAASAEAASALASTAMPKPTSATGGSSMVFAKPRSPGFLPPESGFALTKAAMGRMQNKNRI